MAGRPKSRAARQAALAATSPPPVSAEDESPWAKLAQEMAARKAAEAAPSPPTNRSEAIQLLQQDDREALIIWWRDQMQHLEAEHAARVERLRTAGEHPSPIFADQVRQFGALGMPKDVVAKLLKLSEAEMLLHYGDDWEVGSAMVVSQVSANLLRIATSLNDRVAVKAAIEVMNRRGGEEWRPPAQKIELDDTRKSKAALIDSSKLTFEERQQLRSMVQRIVDGRSTSVVSVVKGGGLVPIEADDEE